MGVLEKLSRKSGVIVGDDVLRLFEYAQEKNFAIPAIVCFLCSERSLTRNMRFVWKQLLTFITTD